VNQTAAPEPEYAGDELAPVHPRPWARRPWVWLGALALVIAAVVAWRVLRPAAKPTYETATVDRGRISAKVTASGTLSALVTVQVGSQVSGRIQALYVDFNSPVDKGQVLAKLDPQLFQAALDQARANFAASQGNLTKAQVQAVDARRQLERTRALAERKLVAQADLDTGQATADAAAAGVEAARGTVEQARAALQQAQVNLAYTTIASPIRGVVLSRNVDVGQTVAASLQAPTLFVLAEDLRKMQVDTSVAEADVGRITEGMEAGFTVDAYPNERFTGRVRQVRNAPQTVQNVVTYDAVIDVDNPELRLKPGMTANVTFVYAEKADVLRVPNAALRFRPAPEPGARAEGRPTGASPASATGDQEGRAVYVLRAGEPVRVPLRTGVSDGTRTEIVSGELAVGDTVITDARTGIDRATPPGGMRRMF